jgi:hypothetical protein
MKQYLSIVLAVVFLLFSDVVYSQREITIITENDLNFGDAYMGYSTTVNHTDAGAAKFRIRQTVSGNPFVSVTLTLPTALLNGAYSIPVIFGPSTTAYSNDDSPAGRINFDPNSPLVTRLQRNDYLYIWLGGVINVPTNIISGVYSSTITLTITIL